MCHSSHKALANWPYHQARKRRRKKAGGNSGGGIEIGHDLTYPIVLNATLIQPPPLWKDWLPAIVSVFIVILGGLITYYVNIKLERDKRQFESRKQAYNEFLDVASEVKCFLDRSKEANQGGPKIDPHEGYDLINHDLNLASAKIRIFGSNKINGIVNKYYPILFESGNDNVYYTFENELIAAIKQEFSMPEEARAKSWRRFWK
jgi:hypothetical protein